MMRRYRSAALVILALLVTVPIVEAGWVARASHSFWRDAVRNQKWPRPFILPDREAVVAPFHVVVSNGWKAQNTLAGYHFSEATGELTEAGRLKVFFITTHAPAAFRTVFVIRDIDAEETADRVSSVQQFLGTLPSELGDMVQVVETNIGPPGWPADYVDTIDRKFAESTPDPRLPESAGTEGAGE